jgi:hypothetical protein
MWCDDGDMVVILMMVIMIMVMVAAMSMIMICGPNDSVDDDVGCDGDEEVVM